MNDLASRYGSVSAPPLHPDVLAALSKYQEPAPSPGLLNDAAALFFDVQRRMGRGFQNVTPNPVSMGIRGAAPVGTRVAEVTPLEPGSDEEFMMRLHQSLNDPLAPYRVWPGVNALEKPVRPAVNDDATWPPPRRRT